MIVSAATQLPNNTAPDPSPVALKDQLGRLDFSQILKDLDLDGDGQISDQEFDAYRTAKAARGEFIAADGPGNQGAGNTAVSDITETLFRKAMENDVIDS